MVERQSTIESSHVVECSILCNEVQTLHLEFSTLQSTLATLVASHSANLEESMQSKVDIGTQIDAIQFKFLPF